MKIFYIEQRNIFTMTKNKTQSFYINLFAPKLEQPACRYDITTLNRINFNFSNENSVNLLMKNKSNFWRYTFTEQCTNT